MKARKNRKEKQAWVVAGTQKARITKRCQSGVFGGRSPEKEKQHEAARKVPPGHVRPIVRMSPPLPNSTHNKRAEKLSRRLQRALRHLQKKSQVHVLFDRSEQCSWNRNPLVQPVTLAPLNLVEFVRRDVYMFRKVLGQVLFLAFPGTFPDDLLLCTCVVNALPDCCVGNDVRIGARCLRPRSGLKHEGEWRGPKADHVHQRQEHYDGSGVLLFTPFCGAAHEDEAIHAGEPVSFAAQELLGAAIPWLVLPLRLRAGVEVVREGGDRRLVPLIMVPSSVTAALEDLALTLLSELLLEELLALVLVVLCRPKMFLN